MKKQSVICLALLCAVTLCLTLAGCGGQPEPEEVPKTTTTTQPEGMTEDKIIALAEQHWGIRDGQSVADDRHVQRMVDISVVSHPTKANPFYVVLLSRQNGDGGWDSLEVLMLDDKTGAVIDQ